MLHIERLHEDAIKPVRAYPTDSGLDLFTTEQVEIPPQGKLTVPTGWKMSVPPLFEIQIRPRSGNSLKKTLMIANSPGTVDCSYRDEVKVIAYNTSSDETLVLPKGFKIAQMVICPVLLWEPIVVTDLSETDRGTAGFGSTGD